LCTAAATSHAGSALLAFRSPPSTSLPDPSPAPCVAFVERDLPRDPRGVAVARYIDAAEQRGMADGTPSAVGLRLIAARP
jgi:hypothetical protein